VRRHYTPAANSRVNRYIPMGRDLQCRLIDGLWHLVTLRPLPQPESKRTNLTNLDVVLNRTIATLTDAEARKQYGRAVYAVARRRLLKKELSQFPIPMEEW
jgi:hypothetical protein